MCVYLFISFVGEEGAEGAGRLQYTNKDAHINTNKYNVLLTKVRKVRKTTNEEKQHKRILFLIGVDTSLSEYYACAHMCMLVALSVEKIFEIQYLLFAKNHEKEKVARLGKRIDRENNVRSNRNEK